MSFVRSIPGLVVATALGAGCAIRHEDADAQPMTVQLAFASLDDAVVANRIDFYVFDAEGQTDACATLQATRLGTSALPAALATKSAQLCSFWRGDITLDSQLGERALYAIAYTTEGDEVFSGCVQQYLGASDAAALPITMSRSGDLTKAVRFGGCASMVERCTGSGC